MAGKVLHGSTHKNPAANATNTPSFCALGKCIFEMAGSGREMIIKSVTILRDGPRYHRILRGRHDDSIETSQEASIGQQKKATEQTSQRPDKATMRRKAYDVLRRAGWAKPNSRR